MLDLSAIAQQFKEATLVEGYERIPNGDYKVKIEGVKFDQTQGKEDKEPLWYLRWDLIVLSADEKLNGKKLVKNNFLKSEQNIKFLKTDLHKAGMPIDDIMQLEKRLHEFNDRKLLITVRTSKKDGQGQTSQNIYFNSVDTSPTPSAMSAMGLGSAPSTPTTNNTPVTNNNNDGFKPPF